MGISAGGSGPTGRTSGGTPVDAWGRRLFHLRGGSDLACGPSTADVVLEQVGDLGEAVVAGERVGGPAPGGGGGGRGAAEGGLGRVARGGGPGRGAPKGNLFRAPGRVVRAAAGAEGVRA